MMEMQIKQEIFTMFFKCVNDIRIKALMVFWIDVILNPQADTTRLLNPKKLQHPKHQVFHARFESFEYVVWEPVRLFQCAGLAAQELTKHHKSIQHPPLHVVARQEAVFLCIRVGQLVLTGSSTSRLDPIAVQCYVQHAPELAGRACGGAMLKVSLHEDAVSRDNMFITLHYQKRER
jgi:hypothetical protein